MNVMGRYKWSILFFLLAVGYGVYISVKDKRSLENNFGVTSGEITGVETHRANGHTIFIVFELKINSKNIEGKTAVFCSESHVRDFKKELIGKKVNVVYEKTDPDNNQILLSKNEYKKFRITPSNESILLLDFIESICAQK